MANKQMRKKFLGIMFNLFVKQNAWSFLNINYFLILLEIYGRYACKPHPLQWACCDKLVCKYAGIASLKTKPA